MKTAKHSFLDIKGHCWTACSECERGGNGSDKDKCMCGYHIRRFNKLGCFIGILLKGLKSRNKCYEKDVADIVQENEYGC